MELPRGEYPFTHYFTGKGEPGQAAFLVGYDLVLVPDPDPDPDPGSSFLSSATDYEVDSDLVLVERSFRITSVHW